MVLAYGFRRPCRMGAPPSLCTQVDGLSVRRRSARWSKAIMRRILAIAVIFTLFAGHASGLQAQATSGTIQGTLTGNAGPLAGVKVNIFSVDGQVMRANTTTAPDGSFAIEGLPPGRYLVQAVTRDGDVLSTTITTVSVENPSAVVKMSAAANQAKATGVSAAGVGKFRATTLAAVISSAATIGVFAVVGTGDDASASK